MSWAQYLAIAVFAFLIVRFVRSPFNEQTIRTLDSGHSYRPKIEEQARRWLHHREWEIRAAKHPYPVVFVSAQGGGIRAAYWTATTLAALEDANPYFSRHIFAISGASGGSLGAAVYTGIVKAKTLGELPSCSSDNAVESRGKAECLASEVLARDFLSPVLSSFLGVDLLSSILRQELPGDRATALELGSRWELWNGSGKSTPVTSGATSRNGLPRTRPSISMDISWCRSRGEISRSAGCFATASATP